MPRLSLSLCVCLLFSAAALNAESRNPADYPLRIHIFGHSQTTFYYGRSLDESKGEGRANLFENDEARGVDYSFDCSQKLKASFGYETYLAKWKKQNQELTVLFPCSDDPTPTSPATSKLRSRTTPTWPTTAG